MAGFIYSSPFNLQLQNDFFLIVPLILASIQEHRDSKSPVMLSVTPERFPFKPQLHIVICVYVCVFLFFLQTGNESLGK